MPRRTNTFQEVVATVQASLAGEAEVEESAELVSRTSGRRREVDVVVRAIQGGHEVVVSIEAVGRGRRADVGWVEQMIAKHAALPTNKLVLVAEAGFTAAAKEAAEAAGVATFAPEDLAVGDSSGSKRIVSVLERVWPKTISLTADQVAISLTPLPGEPVWESVTGATRVFTPDGVVVCVVDELVAGWLQANLRSIAERIDLGIFEADADRRFDIEAAPFRASADGAEVSFCLQRIQGERTELVVIERLRIRGAAKIQVSEVALKHQRLMGEEIAYGEADMGDRRLLWIFAEQGDSGFVAVRDKGQAAR